jgi:hypothetical protein
MTFRRRWKDLALRRVGLIDTWVRHDLDACRQLKSMGGLTDHVAGLFRSGTEVADIFCVVREGAELTV